ncbi:uncharacterized protein LOC141908861 [Tubulanus polymorphus]|uniref:uncharacterized protein LOC141908861 n=1 Tax=Tubulanus polymorphus TaxID=672921 RepID=UPI003DA24C03
MAENDVTDDVIDRLSTGSVDSDTVNVDVDAFEAAEFDQVDNPPDIAYEQAKQTRLSAAKQYKQTVLTGKNRSGHSNASGIARAASPSFLTKRKMRSELKQAEQDLNKSFSGNEEKDENQVLFEDTLPVKGSPSVAASKGSRLLAVQLPEIKGSRSMENLPVISGSNRVLPNVHKRASTDPSQKLPVYGGGIELSKSVENLHMGCSQSPRPPSAGRPRSGMGRRGLAPIVPAAKREISADNKLYASGSEKLYSLRK